MRRPLGVTILAVFVGICGLLGFGQSLGLIPSPAMHLPGPMPDETFTVLRLLADAGYLVAAYGMWRLRRWARPLLFSILITGYVLTALALGINHAISGILVILLLMFYLDQAHVRQAFGLRPLEQIEPHRTADNI